VDAMFGPYGDFRHKQYRGSLIAENDVRLTRISDSLRILIFVGVTYAFSWSSWVSAKLFGDRNALVKLWFYHIKIQLPFNGLLEYVGAIGPSVGLVVIAAFFSSSTQRHQILCGIRKWRVAPRFYVFALLSPFVAFYVADLVRSFGGADPIYIRPPWLWAVDMLFNILPGPLCEELGWRGFLLPELRAKRGNLVAALWVGVIWGVWHIPFRIHTGPRGTSPALFLFVFIIGAVGLSIILAWLYNSSGNAVLPCIIFHTANNSALHFFITPELLRDGTLSPFLGATASVWILAGAILVLDKRFNKGIFWPVKISHEIESGL
jgi:membrane protease YdiL (CAAX protease family)